MHEHAPGPSRRSADRAVDGGPRGLRPPARPRDRTTRADLRPRQRRRRWRLTTASCASTTGPRGSGSSASCDSGPTGWCGTIPSTRRAPRDQCPGRRRRRRRPRRCRLRIRVGREGHRVVVVDRHDAGRATDAGAGILSPETMGGMPAPFLDLADLAAAHYHALIPALADIGTPDPRSRCAARCASPSARWRTKPSRSTPRIARPPPDALRAVTPGEAQARFHPWRTCAARCSTRRRARRRPRPGRRDRVRRRAQGVDWRHGSAQRIVVEQGRATSVECDDGPVACGAVVIAGGAWTPALAGAFGCGAVCVRCAGRSCTSTSTPTRRRGRCSNPSSATTSCRGTTDGRARRDRRGRRVRRRARRPRGSASCSPKASGSARVWPRPRSGRCASGSDR